MFLRITPHTIEVLFPDAREKEQRLIQELKKELKFQPQKMWCG